VRIAYIAPYQGPALMKRRPILPNLSLAGNLKIELISEFLQRGIHKVEVLSQGEVVERRFEFYSAFCEPRPFHADIPVFYSSAFPIKLVNGLWSSLRTLSLFKQRHRASPYDLVIIYNLKRPQVVCARYAMRLLGLPVVLEYEDDAFVDVGGEAEGGFRPGLYPGSAKQIMSSAAGCVGVSPHLLSQVPASIPKLLLRGVVDEDILGASRQPLASRKNWVVYSGTHYRSKGLESLITAWKMVDQPGWELHIAGRGELTSLLEKMAENNKSIVFHGLLNRQENARFLGAAKIGVNPHDVSRTPGNVFAFKIIEYLAAGMHCITTPMGILEADLEAGITYMPHNSPETVASTLKQVIEARRFERLAAQVAQDMYGPEAVSKSLDEFLKQVLNGAARPASERL
jgi:glycosyltransferase involved in cell wall biosynthesis